MSLRWPVHHGHLCQVVGNPPQAHIQLLSVRWTWHDLKETVVLVWASRTMYDVWHNSCDLHEYVQPADLEAHTHVEFAQYCRYPLCCAWRGLRVGNNSKFNIFKICMSVVRVPMMPSHTWDVVMALLHGLHTGHTLAIRTQTHHRRTITDLSCPDEHSITILLHGTHISLSDRFVLIVHCSCT